MKNYFKVAKSDIYENKFLIEYYYETNIYTFDSIQRHFKIPPHIYYNILVKNNGVFSNRYIYNEYYFLNEEDTQSAINELESYIIFNKLIE